MPDRADAHASGVNRRRFLAGSGLVGAATALQGLMGQTTAHAAGPGAGNNRGTVAADNGGYGPLQPAGPDGELLLPAGFTYAAFGRTGTPMRDGTPTPGRHDGMAAFEADDGALRLVRNHEQSGGEAFASPSYDPQAAGGTTTLVVDREAMRLVDSFPSLTGTIRNCAGGPTPWGSWLSCEETFTGLDTADPHGYIFEVPVDADGPVEPVPYRAMGRFTHEAVAVDPATGIVYETEDRGSSGLYRFVPDTPGRLGEGGKLQMLAIKGDPRYDTRTGQRAGKPLAVEWVDIDDPDPDSGDSLAVFNQGRAKGGAVFARLEGAWYGDGAIYVNSTSGGDAGLGQVWEYRPRGRSGGQLILVYESVDPDLLQSPDNICVSPNSGGLVLCEDGSGGDMLRGVTDRGEIFDFAALNSTNTSELAGATFSPDGRTLFFNVQSPGITYAVTGPWSHGAL
ncbi:PhoX family protein [Streptomonospora salina]|uniref:Secreted PhoX family phosphatase n=1 Tax=Streptomonospora salina TaxID=104205 RepID=A0A841EDM6_9ACTN|nr:alkaline phosphatase PhoX [Streptomonospora salina]MBB5999048.1 secreted PhoX family phosphatase [Streptomonospora salina]